MIIRIVKMTIAPSKIEDFLKIYSSNMSKIRGVNGCNKLHLLQDEKYQNIFMTYSFWNNQNDLEAYRNSELFKSIWKTVKPFFADTPQAWSLQSKFEI